MKLTKSFESKVFVET